MTGMAFAAPLLYSALSSNTCQPSVRPAARSAMTSAWALGSRSSTSLLVVARAVLGSGRPPDMRGLGGPARGSQTRMSYSRHECEAGRRPARVHRLRRVVGQRTSVLVTGMGCHRLCRKALRCAMGSVG